MTARGEPHEIPLERLQLNLSNPRHEEVEARDEAMIELLSSEQIVELARDIAGLGGINPMERLGVFPVEGTGNDEEQFYAAAEGNRRLCALMLLDDPEAVPAEMPNRARYVRTFNKLSQQIDPITQVPCVVFENMDAARPWLERLHNGARDGTGRRRWTPEQQARNTSDQTNRAATQLRDLAIELGLVTANQLSRTTTTQQRFISNARFRQAMGLVRLNDGSLERTRCWPDFLLMLRQFMTDIATGAINSRSHNSRTEIEAYAQQIEAMNGLELRNVRQGELGQREDEIQSGAEDETDESGHEPGNGEGTEDGVVNPGADDNADDNARHRPAKRTAINQDDEIVAALHRLGNQKLIDLYASFATVRLPQHALLAVIGCWSFFECMVAAHGYEGNDFTSYINRIVGNLGVSSTPKPKARKYQLDWISKSGNITKHDWQTATYDHAQLCNAMDTLKPIVVAMIEDIADQKPNQ